MAEPREFDVPTTNSTNSGDLEFTSKVKLNLALSGIGIVSFFLPWLEIGFNNIMIHRISGLDIALDYPLVWLFPLGLFIHSIATLTGKYNFLFFRNLFFILPVVVFIVYLFKGIQTLLSLFGTATENVATNSTETSDFSFGQLSEMFHVSLGFYGFLIAIVGVLIVGAKK
jgi:hypothetical protein